MTDQLYKDFDNAGLIPLWNLREELMPSTPNPKAVPSIWHWDELYPLAARAGELVPVGRGGERRAIAVSNPGLPGLPYATPTLWAAIQYLGPNEVAPAHRHSQNAFRFVVEGEGVWTVVDGDPVAMRRGDLLLTPGWCFHGHRNPNPQPMAWLDGLDIPFVHYTDSGFFEFGEDGVDDRSTPERSRSERLWGHPGLRPLTAPSRAPLVAYRWQHTDAALHDQLALAEGLVEPNHAAVRFINPATGTDALSTMRMEMHRVVDTSTAPRREAASSVWQVFDGTGAITLDGTRTELRRGDLIAVPSWCSWSIEGDLDLFRFSDAPILERLGLYREQQA
ncbi:cupin [Actinoplanes sp. ATCC 53533]|uniref:cupin domain-containing protein n=1 Tax=Actinoplanes sp. ATCC 53533 TaxID=1288362 RepID=UPI000F787BFC|nr:cupin domain-containing protein [Actinoplanes sp. ATCC 53533]RSM64768.1 cupin [Actinoplanes sp. ATCC 53533]